MDPFWEMDRPTPVQPNQIDKPGPSSAGITSTSQNMPIPIKEGEIDSKTNQDPSVLEVSAIKWTRYVGVKSVQYVKMGYAPRIAAEVQNDWSLEQAVRETEKNFSTDLQQLMTETTNNPNLLKTLVCLEKQQHEMIPEEYRTHRRKLSSRFGLVFMEDRIIVPKNLLAINTLSLAARQFWWPKMAEAIQKICETCIPCKVSGESNKPNIPSTEKIAYHR